MKPSTPPRGPVRPPGCASPRRSPGPLPPEVRAVLAQRLFVAKAGLPSPLLNQIKRLAAFQNPEFYKKQRMRLSTALTPRVIACAEEHPEHLALPRGCRSDLEALLHQYGVRLAIDDQRTDGDSLDVHFHGELTPLQADAARALLSHDTGVFVGPPGMGKTVLGVYLAAQRRRSTLVLVHRRPLLDQWKVQLAMFLGIEDTEIGEIGRGKQKATGRLDVAMLQSVTRKDSVDDRVATYGQVIVDECHHMPAVSFERVLSEVRARYVVGLTATPQRRDGHHPITEMQLGPVRYTAGQTGPRSGRPFDTQLIIRETRFRLVSEQAILPIQALYRELAADPVRNDLILTDVISAIAEGRSPILLTERKDHLTFFAERLRGFVKHLVVLQGGMTEKKRRTSGTALAAIPDDEERLVLATGRYIGEGFDDARLDTLFLALPISWKGTLVQYTGRLHRPHPRKIGRPHLRLRRPRGPDAPEDVRAASPRVPRDRLCQGERGEWFYLVTARRTARGGAGVAPHAGEAPMRSDMPRRGRRVGKRSALSAARLDALIAEALVDAYGDSEERTAFYTVLEGSLALPFTTQVLGVEVLVERLDLTPDKQIVAVCRHGRARQRIPILDLPLPDVLPQGTEWIEAYRRWANAAI